MMIQCKTGNCHLFFYIGIVLYFLTDEKGISDCKIILTLAEWFRRCYLKKFLMTDNGVSIFSYVAHSVQWSIAILSVLVGSYKNNISVKLF